MLDSPEQQVVIGGYGRVGHAIAVLLHSSGVPFIAFDNDPERVAQGRADGFRVFYGDISDPGLLSAIHIERASLIILSIDQFTTSLGTITGYVISAHQYLSLRVRWISKQDHN